MTIDNIHYVDKLVYHESVAGYGEMNLTFKLNKGFVEGHHGVHEEIEINLGKEDTEQLLMVLINLYIEACPDNGYQIDLIDKETKSKENLTVDNFNPEFNPLL